MTKLDMYGSRIIIPLSTASFILNSIIRFFIPAILPFIVVSMHTDLFYGSLLLTAYWIGYTVLQVPGGILSDIFGTAMLNKISFLSLTVLFIILYFSLDSYIAVLVLQLALGSVSAFIYVSDASLVQKWNRRDKRSSALGIYQLGFFVGASIGEYFTISTYVISSSFPFLIMFPLLAIVTILNMLFLRDPAKRRRKILISKRVIFPALLRFSAGFVYIGFLAMFSSILAFNFHVPENKIFLYSWIPAFLGIVSSPVGGYMSVKLRNGRLLFAALPIMVIGVVIALISFVDFLTAMFLSSLLGLFYGFYAGPSMSMASDVSGNDESLSSASSILNLSSQSGGIVSPLIIGYSYSVFGSFKWGLITISLVSVFLMIISIHFLRRHGIT